MGSTPAKVGAVPLLEDVGRRIAEVRISRGWTQEQCAVELEITVRRLRRFEAGANMTLLTLERIAVALGVTVRSLFDAPAKAQPRKPGRPRKARPPEPPPEKIVTVAERQPLPKARRRPSRAAAAKR
jgi:transcriptional regulator with XRE-family HTH domain